MQLEEQNLRLQEQISHLKGELKAAGSFSTGETFLLEYEQSAQAVLELQRKLELHKVSAQELEQELVLEIQNLKLALRGSQGSEDAEITRLRAAAQDNEVRLLASRSSPPPSRSPHYRPTVAPRPHGLMTRFDCSLKAS